MKVIAIIPARGGSKRLPQKNIIPFNKAPLISYSIKAAKLSKRISDIYVSTDDEEIAQISKLYDAKIIVRPNSIAGDYTSSSEVLIHAKDYLKLNFNDIIITLQPTNPLRPKNIVDKTIDFALKMDFDSWDSIMSVSYLKHKFGSISNNLYLPYNYNIGQRSQDIENNFVYENGIIYVTNIRSLSLQKNMFGKNIIPLILEGDYCAYDIDDDFDLKSAESAYKILKQKYNLV